MELATIIAAAAAAVSSLFAGIGLIFAGWQLRIAHKQHEVERRVAYEGVAVSWLPLEAPAKPDADGTALWLYQITVQNPGKLPIQNVAVQVTFPVEVVRIRYDGSRDRPVRTLTMNHPVLGGGESRVWRRRLRIAFAARDKLKETYAHVRFHDVDGEPHSNSWPDGPDAASAETTQLRASDPPKSPQAPEKPGDSRHDDSGRPAEKSYEYDAVEDEESQPLGDIIERLT
ncbi:MAG: hypothetical protein GEV04_17745 [Actinophytocola sp.]|nr:hypothetical protein [Actinophytocola sp.]